jgi:hypothetical protein
MGLVLSNKMVRQCNGFLVQAAALVRCVHYNRHVINPDGGRLAYFHSHRAKMVSKCDGFLDCCFQSGKLGTKRGFLN